MSTGAIITAVVGGLLLLATHAAITGVRDELRNITALLSRILDVQRTRAAGEQHDRAMWRDLENADTRDKP